MVAVQIKEKAADWLKKAINLLWEVRLVDENGLFVVLAPVIVTRNESSKRLVRKYIQTCHLEVYGRVNLFSSSVIVSICIFRAANNFLMTGHKVDPKIHNWLLRSKSDQP